MKQGGGRVVNLIGNDGVKPSYWEIAPGAANANGTMIEIDGGQQKDLMDRLRDRVSGQRRRGCSPQHMPGHGWASGRAPSLVAHGVPSGRESTPLARTDRSSQSLQPSLRPPGAACQDAHGFAAPARPA
jgi:hypothetical protein